MSVIVTDVEQDHAGFASALGIAIGALVVTLVLRAAYVTPLLWGVSLRARRGERLKPRIADMQESLADPNKARPERDLTRFSTRMRRAVADIDYLLEAPLGWREGSIVVWAGMRGAVTVAAAQTLPADTPDRSLLVLIAYLVATLSLMLQGGTLAWVIRWVKPSAVEAASVDAEHTRLTRFLDDVTADAASDRFDRRGALARIDAQRSALLDARDDGTFDADVLATALARLDAKQITLELHDDSAQEGSPRE